MATANRLELFFCRRRSNDYIERKDEISEADGGCDTTHCYRCRKRGLADAKSLIKQNGAIWVSWYKKAAKLPTEITEDTIREAAFPLGLVDVKVCAVDEKMVGAETGN